MGPGLSQPGAVGVTGAPELLPPFGTGTLSDMRLLETCPFRTLPQELLSFQLVNGEPLIAVRSGQIFFYRHTVGEQPGPCEDLIRTARPVDKCSQVQI